VIDTKEVVTRWILNEGDSRWHPPTDSGVKINVDRAWLKEENRAGAGVVVARFRNKSKGL